MNKLRTYTIDEEVYKEFKIQCIKNNTKPSQVIRNTILKYINNEKEYNDKHRQRDL